MSTAAGQITKDLRALLPSWITEVRFREAIDVNGRFVLFLFMGQCQHSGFRAVTLDTAADDTAGDVPMPAQRLQSCDIAVDSQSEEIEDAEKLAGVRRAVSGVLEQHRVITYLPSFFFFSEP